MENLKTSPSQKLPNASLSAGPGNSVGSEFSENDSPRRKEILSREPSVETPDEKRGGEPAEITPESSVSVGSAETAPEVEFKNDEKPICGLSGRTNDVEVISGDEDETVVDCRASNAADCLAANSDENYLILNKCFKIEQNLSGSAETESENFNGDFCKSVKLHESTSKSTASSEMSSSFANSIGGSETVKMRLVWQTDFHKRLLEAGEPISAFKLKNWSNRKIGPRRFIMSGNQRRRIFVSESECVEWARKFNFTMSEMPFMKFLDADIPAECAESEISYRGNKDVHFSFTGGKTLRTLHVVLNLTKTVGVLGIYTTKHKADVAKRDYARFFRRMTGEKAVFMTVEVDGVDEKWSN